MKPGTMRPLLSLACLAISLGTTGCGMLFDLSYLVGSKRYDESKEERKPTGQVSTSIEYDSVVTPDGQIHLACEERERRIERTFSVSKTYEYRGGYTRGVHVTAAVLSAVAGGAYAGVIAIACNLPPQPGAPDTKRWSCINALYATPFAVDVGWSIIRAINAKPPKLVDKHKDEGRLAFAPIPTRSNPTSCDSIDHVVLGNVQGPSDLDALNSGTGEGQRLVEGSIPVVRGADGNIQLISQPNVVNAWAKNAGMEFWIINREGKPQPLKVDRCNTLRLTISVMQPTEQSTFFRECPLPGTTPPR